MIDKKPVIDAKRKAYLEEEAHYKRLSAVFGTPDGVRVVEWILNELCGYWAPTIVPNELERYSVGRALFNAISFADIEIAHKILSNRRASAKAAMQEERKQIENEAKREN